MRGMGWGIGAGQGVRWWWKGEEAMGRSIVGFERVCAGRGGWGVGWLGQGCGA